MNEFALIDAFFNPISPVRADVILGMGDDAAVLRVSPEHVVLVSCDTLVSGVHFLPDWDAFDIAWRAVMVNISDMAAMAATPCWMTLALTLPEVNLPWLERFSQGMKAALKHYQVALVGGDTTRGPLSLTLTIQGIAPERQVVRRSGAKPGDVIMVTGELGGAALAVAQLGEKIIPEALMDKLLRPTPRVEWIDALRQYASAAIDISDGLSADLGHVCNASGVGACLDAQAIPLHPLLNSLCDPEQALERALTGGDDYELCFTVPPELTPNVLGSRLACYPIGVIEAHPGLRIKQDNGVIVPLRTQGYRHF